METAPPGIPSGLEGTGEAGDWGTATSATPPESTWSTLPAGSHPETMQPTSTKSAELGKVSVTEAVPTRGQCRGDVGSWYLGIVVCLVGMGAGVNVEVFSGRNCTVRALRCSEAKVRQKPDRPV